MGVEIIKHYYEVSEVAQLRHLALLSAGNEGEDLFGKGDHNATRQRQDYLLELLQTHGAREYAYALNDLSGRAIENALATLPTVERSQVLKHLSRRAQTRLDDVEGLRRQPTHAVLTLPSFVM